MGFMDKAKKLAEQAQEKLDDAQKNFNQSASPQAEQPAQAVRYDEHGRPIQEEGRPRPRRRRLRGRAGRAAARRGAQPPPAAGAARPPTRPSGGANTSPDPFKPIQ